MIDFRLFFIAAVLFSTSKTLDEYSDFITKGKWHFVLGTENENCLFSSGDQMRFANDGEKIWVITLLFHSVLTSQLE